MGKQPSNEQYSESDTIERREAALKRMLSTPHKPHSESKLGKGNKRRRSSPKQAAPVEKGR